MGRPKTGRNRLIDNVVPVPLGLLFCRRGEMPLFFLRGQQHFHLREKPPFRQQNQCIDPNNEENPLMAGIKSTMDLVMERAARMGMATPEEMRHEDNMKQGMQSTVAFLNGTAPSLNEMLAEFAGAEQESVRKGMLTSLLRNLFLPRDEDGIARIERAIRGLVELNSATPDIGSLCREVQTIALQYGQHRQQLYDQLKEQMRMQIEQLLLRKGMKPDSLKFDPTTEPQFKEQWSRLEADLDGQYGQALEQFKAQLKAWLGL